MVKWRRKLDSPAQSVVACHALEKELMKNHTAVFALVAIVAVVSAVAQNSVTNAPPPKSDEVVARVGDVAIHRHELDMAVGGLLAQIQRQGRIVPPEQRQQLQYDVLNGLIEREVVLQFAKANRPADLDEKVKAQIERTRAMAGGEEPLLKSLQEAGVSRAEFERRTSENVIVTEALRHVAEAQVKVPPDDVKAFYEANITRFKQPEVIRASHILVRVEPADGDDIKKVRRTKINAARSFVLGGEKFADIARKYSDDPGSAAKGGDLGFFPHGSMVPEFEKVAFSLGTNQVSEVITTQFGYHVLIVTDRKAEKQLSLDEVKADIERLLQSRKSGDVIRQYVKGLREKAKVEIFLSPLPALATNTPLPAASARPPAATPKP